MHPGKMLALGCAKIREILKERKKRICTYCTRDIFLGSVTIVLHDKEIWNEKILDLKPKQLQEAPSVLMLCAPVSGHCRMTRK